MTHDYGIFISYRHDEAAGSAGRIYDELVRQFGEGLVFRDTESIGLGLDFQAALANALDSCEIMLVIMGPTWADARDDNGNRCLESPSDWVRQEIEAGLARDGVRVVPVLVQGAALPRVERLPESIQPLIRRQAIEISDARFHVDMSALLGGLESVIAGAREAGAPQVARLETLLPGIWVVDVQNPMVGAQTMRVQVTAGQGFRQFEAEAVIGQPGWRGSGTWQVLPPGDRVAMTGTQAAQFPYPQMGPLQEVFSFTSVSQEAMQGTNSVGAPVTWRRE